MKKPALISVLMLLGGSGVASGCGDEIENTIDCAEICDRFDECVTDIDTGECTDRCEDRADASQMVEDDLEDCEDCIEDRTCAEAEPCWDDCPVVPVE